MSEFRSANRPEAGKVSGPDETSNLVPRLSRPAVAIISNSHTPYRAHLHQRIVCQKLNVIHLDFDAAVYEVAEDPREFAL